MFKQFVYKRVQICLPVETACQNLQNAKGTGLWKKGKWRLVFKRDLVNNDPNDVQFRQSVLMAVAVWNGSNRELNGQKGLAGWMLLKFS